MGFLNILGEAEIHTIPKIWEKWIPIVRENKHFKVKHFLNSLYEGEINACPKIWEKCFSIVREKHGKAQTF